MSHKFYFRVVLCIIAGFVLLNFFVWISATRPLLSGNDAVGDMARMGYLPQIVNLNKTDGAPGGKHIRLWDYQGQDIMFLTMGDSFSQGGGHGYYQDWIAGIVGGNVLNLNEIFWYPVLPDRLDPVVQLLNDGYFERFKPRYLIIQSVERLGETFARSTDWTAHDKAAAYKQYLAERENKTRLSTSTGKGFFNSAACKYLLNKMTYALTGHDYDKNIYLGEMTSDLFSGSAPNMLVYYYQDLDWARKNTKKLTTRINDNLNRMAELLRKKGIELIYLPAVDKYDLYFDYLVDKDHAPHPPKLFFETLRSLPKNYYFVDTKEILSQELARGEKDVFWQDDTHWSWKASRAVAENIKQLIRSPLKP